MPKHKLAILICLTLLIIFLLIFSAKSGFNLFKIQDFIKGLGYLAPIIFILIYTVGPVFFFPITPLAVIGGVLFGPVWGTIYSVIGVTLGGCLAFLVSRYLLKEWVDKKSPGRVEIVQEAVKKEGWKFIALARITPVFPFNAQNYIFGVTSIPLRIFALATIISMIPGSFAYVYLGYAGQSAASGSGDIARKITIALILLLTVSFVPYIIKKVRKNPSPSKN